MPRILAGLLIVMSFLSSQFIWAGADSSGGGNSVVCFVSPEARESVFNSFKRMETDGINWTNPFSLPSIIAQVTSVESLDLFLHRLPRGRNQNEIVGLPAFSEQSKADQIVRTLVDRLGTKCDLADDIRDIQRVLNDESWVKADGVAKIADTGLPVLVPPNCLVSQIAHRRGDQIFFDQYLFSKMDEVNKAALILHELLYRIAKDHGAVDAFPVYQAVSLMFLPDDRFSAVDPVALARKLTVLSPDPEFGLRARYSLKVRGVDAPVDVYVNSQGGSGAFRLRSSVAVPVGNFVFYALSGTELWSDYISNGDVLAAEFTSGKKASGEFWVNYLGGQSLNLAVASLRSPSECDQTSRGCLTGNLANSFEGQFRLGDLTLSIKGPVEVRVLKDEVVLDTWNDKDKTLSVTLSVGAKAVTVEATSVTVADKAKIVKSLRLKKDLRVSWRKTIPAGTELQVGTSGQVVIP